MGGTGLYFWHAYQTRRSADAILAQVEQMVAEAEKQAEKSSYSDAASLLFSLHADPARRRECANPPRGSL